MTQGGVRGQNLGCLLKVLFQSTASDTWVNTPGVARGKTKGHLNFCSFMESFAFKQQVVTGIISSYISLMMCLGCLKEPSH